MSYPFIIGILESFRSCQKRSYWTGTSSVKLFFNTEKDQFILSSGEAAITIREKDFGIIADRRTETLEFRKSRLLARMQEISTLVYEYLKSILDSLLGKGTYEIDLDINRFEMDVFVTPETIYYKEVKKLSRTNRTIKYST